MKTDYCFANINDHCIDDLINMETKTGVYSKKSIPELQKDNPTAKVMKISEWSQIRHNRQNTPVQWVASTAANYDYALGCLPPIAYNGSGFLIGEPYDHDALTGKPRFTAHIMRGDKFFKSDRPMTIERFTKGPLL